MAALPVASIVGVMVVSAAGVLALLAPIAPASSGALTLQPVPTHVAHPTVSRITAMSTHAVWGAHPSQWTPSASLDAPLVHDASAEANSPFASNAQGRSSRYSLWVDLTAASLTAAAAATLLWWRTWGGRSPLRPLDLGAKPWGMASVSVNPELLKQFGLPVAEGAAYPGLAESVLARRSPGGVPSHIDNSDVGYSKASLASTFGLLYRSFNLDHPGMKVHSIDPPVLTIDGFLDAPACDELVALVPPLLQPSPTGSRRTSSFALFDESLLAAHPSLEALAAVLQSRVKTLFPSASWDPSGKLPPPGALCLEGLQAARYEAGQSFADHQDAFPLMTAKHHQFQRLATILVYLNDVSEGGQMRFPHLDLSITPKKSMALVFFPAFGDGRPDDRMLHEACPAVSVKWIAQQWVAVGVNPGAGVRVPTAVLSSPKETSKTTPSEVEEQKRAIEAKMEAMEEHNRRALAARKPSQESSQEPSQKPPQEPPRKPSREPPWEPAQRGKVEQGKMAGWKLGPKRGFGG